MSKLLVLAAVLSASVFLLACGGGDDDDATAESTAAAGGGGVAGAPLAVTALDFRFNPPELAVSTGEEVTLRFNNNGGTTHTFTIDDVVDSGNVDSGNGTELSFSVAEPGTYTFYCLIHGAATMSGTLVVE